LHKCVVLRKYYQPSVACARRNSEVRSNSTVLFFFTRPSRCNQCDTITPSGAAEI
jgi:hypothetical protein